MTEFYMEYRFHIVLSKLCFVANKQYSCTVYMIVFLERSTTPSVISNVIIIYFLSRQIGFTPKLSGTLLADISALTALNFLSEFNIR